MSEQLDRAIDAAKRQLTAQSIRDAGWDFAFARALIRELFTNLQPPADATCYERDMWEDTIATILRTAGLEGEG
jgi:hypothetical protein